MTGRHFLSQVGKSYHKKKIPATGRKLMSQEGDSCQRKEISVKGKKFIRQEVISCYRKGIHVTGGKEAIILVKRCRRMLKITAFSQEILEIPATPAGSPEENNTLMITLNCKSVNQTKLN